MRLIDAQVLKRTIGRPSVTGDALSSRVLDSTVLFLSRTCAKTFSGAVWVALAPSDVFRTLKPTK